METTARVTAKGQVTIPKSVRDALGVSVGDALIFRVVGDHAVVSPAGTLIELAGSVPVPAARRGSSWDEVRRETRTGRFGRRR